MFKFQPHHEEVFRRASLGRFEDNTIRHLREHLMHPTRGYSDEQLRLRVRACIPLAGKYGLVSEQQVICFVDATFLLAEHFDTDRSHAWAGELLRDRDLVPARKAGILLTTAADLYNARSVEEGPGP